MELAAIELYKATNENAYLTDAMSWATDYNANSDQDILNLYDVAGLAHYELYKVLATQGTQVCYRKN
jgi:hypothetical protein